MEMVRGRRTCGPAGVSAAAAAAARPASPSLPNKELYPLLNLCLHTCQHTYPKVFHLYDLAFRVFIFIDIKMDFVFLFISHDGPQNTNFKCVDGVAG